MQEIIINKILNENFQDLPLIIYISKNNSPYFKKFELLNNKMINKLVDSNLLFTGKSDENIEILNLNHHAFDWKNVEVIKEGINSICSNEKVKYILKVGNETLEFKGNSILRKLHGMHHKTFYKNLDDAKLSNTEKYIFVIRWMQFINNNI
ncbi:hypothetical protein [uncultured Empedobacter sp.]|uniref:hypothetical protein n=1 Tax=uncultured Empedobacter sp. TaxID=410844 RepID=UPI0025F0485A|nr:hypothetical protein [uncultured Empedobacter sp.]